MELIAQSGGAKGVHVYPSLVKLLKKFNPKYKRFNRLLDFISKEGGGGLKGLYDIRGVFKK